MENRRTEGRRKAADWRFSFYIELLIALMCIQTQEAVPVVSDNDAMRYLSQYGYLPPVNPTISGLISEDSMNQAIVDFQLFAGLNATGILDNETAIMMSLPRCGVKDKVGPSSDGRSKRYALQGSRWRVKKLTYKISKYPRNLDKASVDKDIARAFGVWSDYTDLTFTQKKKPGENVHIDIRFERGEHGDGDPFDGPGGTLAHAYFPVYGGDAHFDDAERWTVDSNRGTNLFQVAAHEFGHSLGLSHSDIKAALMAPFYRGYDPNFELDIDDVYGIQALYGKKTNSGGSIYRTSTIPTREEDAQLCTDPKVDTMFNSADDQLYVFKGDYYWRLTDDGVASGYPKLIGSSWKGLPGNIDAAFTYKNGKTYFFKGSKYWRYIGKKMDGQYPKEISEGFTGIPDDVDAATVWTGNGKIYFYKGTKFWRFDPAQRPPVKSTYPKLIANWEGLPNNLDAAITYQRYTYFFKDNTYYRFNDRTFSVDIADPAFPRATAAWWFGCKSASRGTLGNVGWSSNYADYSLSENLEKVDGDHFSSNNNQEDVGDIIFDAGDTDELVTTANQDSGASSITGSRNQQILRLSVITALLSFVIRFVLYT